MKTFVLTAALMFATGLAQAQTVERGARVFTETCSACHVESMSAEETTTADIAAPPMNLLTTIIREKTGNTEAAFVAHVTDFVVHPAREKVKAMPEAVDRFGLMLPIGETAPSVTPDDLRAVAAWLYSHYDYETELKQLEEHEREEAEREKR